MELMTAGEMLTQIKNDMDLIEDPMITEAELYGYLNQAIKEVEKFLPEDYFTQKASLALVNGQTDYDFPANIFAQKVKKVFYDNSGGLGTGDCYEIKRIRRLEQTVGIQSLDRYRYLPYTDENGSHKIRLYPAAQEDSQSNVTIWFKGDAKKLTQDSDVMNIPEASTYVIEKTKLMCARKEGHPHAVDLEQEVERQRDLMITALTPMIEDEDNRVILDVDDYDYGVCF